jgi:hypothetical protein
VIVCAAVATCHTKGKHHRMVIYDMLCYRIGRSHDYRHHSCRDQGSGTGLGWHQNGDVVPGRGQESGTGLGFGHGWLEQKSSFAHEGKTQDAGQDKGQMYEQRQSGPMSVNEPHHENQKDSGVGYHGV